MSKQETTSTQSLPVDDAGPNGSGVPSDPVSATNATDTGASQTTSSASNAAAEVAKKTGKILGMSKHVFAAVMAVVAVSAAVVAGVVLTQQPALEDWYDSNAAQGQFEGKSKEEIQAALNEEVAKGMMNISIAASITFADGSSEGEARIENIAANPMDQKVVITLKGFGRDGVRIRRHRARPAYSSDQTHEGSRSGRVRRRCYVHRLRPRDPQANRPSGR